MLCYLKLEHTDLGIIILYNYILLYIDCNIIQSELLHYHIRNKRSTSYINNNNG